MLKLAVFIFGVCVLYQDVEGFCWEPGTSPFTGPPKTLRVPEGDRIMVVIQYKSVTFASI
jgi:hypothetical protein